MDIVIRLDYILQDMKYRLKECKEKDQIDEFLTNAWQYENTIMVEQGYGENEIYCGVEREDLKRAIDNGINIYDLHKVVQEVLTTPKKTMFFSEKNGVIKVYTAAEINNEIEEKIETIAYNTLYKPFEKVYTDLYKEYVIPMIKQQQ